MIMLAEQYYGRYIIEPKALLQESRFLIIQIIEEK